jgi:hypothetical protein
MEVETMRKDILKILEYCKDNGFYISDETKVQFWEKDRDFSKDQLKVLSYGGGTQSTAMLILIKLGKITKPDIVIHADTGSELPETIEFIQIAKNYVEDVLKIPFAIVKSHRGSLHEDYIKHGNIPIIGSRSCTSNFKIQPQRRLVRAIVGRRNKHLANSMLGITTDEEKRRTQGEVQWLKLVYPLLDEFRYTRKECILLNNLNGWDVKKSGCFCCPYQGGKAWIELKQNYPDLFQIAIDMEEKKIKVKGGRLGLYQERPLREIDNITLEASKCDSGAGCFL